MKIKRKYLEFLLRAMSFETDECILWPWGTQTGYGSFFKDKKRALAHIFVCHGAHGEPPTTKHEVAHSCGVRKCINKRHLRWATKSENMADKLIHGTHNRGERGRADQTNQRTSHRDQNRQTTPNCFSQRVRRHSSNHQRCQAPQNVVLAEIRRAR